MTGTNLQQKRSETGAALLLTVSMIGLAFVVTLAAFLIGASVAQDTERLASAKVDVANREDTLLRLILQQTATGMLPGTDGINGSPQNWITIMTNAVNQLRATTYVDQAELAALTGSTGAIADNTGDTGRTALGPLGILQGYDTTQEIPFGGTSGVANVVAPYNATIQPPLMSWSGNATLSSSNAVTLPQEFFLGSQYSGLSAAVTKLSLSSRWGLITYPNIRFGYKGPGDPFIARRVWWRIPVVYQTKQQTVEDASSVYRYPSAPANYILSVYEIPSQLPISGNANLQIGQNADGTNWGSNVQITGSIYGGQIQLYGGTYSGISGVSRGGISSRQQVNVLGQATVAAGTTAAEAYSDNFYDNLKVRETRDLTRSISTTGIAQIGAAPVSVAGNDGKALVVPVMSGANFYMQAPNNTPTHWDLYARPYYKCRIRILISQTDSNLIYNPTANPPLNSAMGAIKVTIIVSPDTTGHPDQIVGFADSGGITTTYTQTSYATGGLPNYMTYTSTGTASGRNILVINIGRMVAALGNPSQLYSIYIGSNPTTEPYNPTATASDPGIAITGTNDLSSFTNGLSIVANQAVYLLDQFNQVKIPATNLFPATSIYSPDIRYGVSGVNPTLNLTGQVSADPTPTPSPIPSPSPTPANPLRFVDAANNAVSISSTSNQFTLTEITDPTTKQMPPITRLTLLFTIEKERPAN